MGKSAIQQEESKLLQEGEQGTSPCFVRSVSTLSRQLSLYIWVKGSNVDIQVLHDHYRLFE